MGALAFPVVGSVGVVAVRQLVAGVGLGSAVRPRLRGLDATQWAPVLGLALVFSVMNLSLYAAIDRIGLGLSVTLEFLGPLTVAVALSRRRSDAVAAAVAGVGVVVLTSPGPSSDLLGIGLALVAAVAWGCYILLNRTLGRRLPGLHGTAAASLVSAVCWTPVAAVWFLQHPPSPAAMLFAVTCGLMSSIVPYAADLLALRRVSPALFGTFTSANPVWAALAGLIVLGQGLAVHEWVGIGVIALANIVVSTAGGAHRPERARHDVGECALLDRSG